MTDTDDLSRDEARFWNWSLETYARQGIADRLLRLQDDHGLDVNSILWCLWAGSTCPPLPGDICRRVFRQVDDWAANVTIPLRGARKWLKGRDVPAPQEALNALRNDIKKQELAAEHVCQTMMERLTAQQAGNSGDPALPGSPAMSTTPAMPATHDRARDYFRLYLSHVETSATPPLENAAQLGKNPAREEAATLFAEICQCLETSGS